MAKQKASLEERIAHAGAETLAALGYVSPVDILLGIRWLNGSWWKRWQQGEIADLETGMQISPERIAEAVALLRAWAAQQGLQPTEATYVTRTPQHQPLRFTRAGDPAVEALFRIHWLSPALPHRKRENLVAKASQPPEQVVIEPLKDWKCHRCGGSGGMLVMETSGPVCLSCAGLDDLEFLPRGDALLTRRARARSTRSAVVVRFSRARKRAMTKCLPT